MITCRIAEVNDTSALLKIMESYTKIYGIDTISSGLRQIHIESIERSFTDHDMNTVVAVDSDQTILGFCVQQISKNYDRWHLQITYISQSNRYNSSEIGGIMMDKLVALAEEQGKYEFVYVVRDIEDHRLKQTLSYTVLLKEKYHIYDYLVIPPLTIITDKKIEKILGAVNGKNTKTIVIRHAHVKNLY